MRVFGGKTPALFMQIFLTRNAQSFPKSFHPTPSRIPTLGRRQAHYRNACWSVSSSPINQIPQNKSEITLPMVNNGTTHPLPTLLHREWHWPRWSQKRALWFSCQPSPCLETLMTPEEWTSSIDEQWHEERWLMMISGWRSLAGTVGSAVTFFFKPLDEYIIDTPVFQAIRLRF